MKTILLVDDHKMIRDAFKFYLGQDDEFQVADEASNGQEALDKLTKNRFDIVVTDISMPVMNGIEFMENINLNFPDQKVLVISSEADIKAINKMIALGAKGYLLKTADKPDLKMALSLISAGRSYYDERVHQIFVKHSDRCALPKPDPSRLSRGELLVLQMIVRELSDQKIAQQLSIELEIVEKVKRSLLIKTRNKCTAGLVLFALDNQLV